MQEEQSFVSASDGARLNVRVYTGETPNVLPNTPVRDILLLHGWPFSSQVWRRLADRLIIAAPFRVIAPDLRGFGGSDAPESGYTVAQFADDVNAVATAFNLNGATLVGHSMSGKIAQFTAAQKPSWLGKLVLITPTPLSLPPTPADTIAAVRDLYGDQEKVRGFLSQLSPRPLTEPYGDAVLAEAMQVSRAAWNGWNEAMHAESFPDLTQHITAETLVVAGKQDTTRPPASVEEHVANRIKGAKYVIMPSIGHLPHVEEPTALAMLIVNFLDGLPVEAS